MSKTQSDDIVVIGYIGYTDDATIRQENGVVLNHDELVEQGKTVYQYRALPDTNATRQQVPDSLIIEPGDDEWRDEFDDWDAGHTAKLTRTHE